MLSVAFAIAVFTVAVFGIGPALMPPALGSALERVTAGIAASLLALYLIGFAVFALGVPPSFDWLAIGLGLVIPIWRRKTLVALWDDAEVRLTAVAWIAVSAWALALGFAVYSFSGSSWMADWSEHYDRARFFIERRDIHHLFLGGYSLAARPPLINVATAVLLSAAGKSFAVYQCLCALLAGLVIWPTLVLQKRFLRPDKSHLQIGWVVLLFLALPAFAENATFTWTKLPTAFFVLVGLALLVPRQQNRTAKFAGWLSLAAGMICHYSTGPWIIAIGLATLIRNPAEWRWVTSRHGLATAGVCIGILATWIGWSSARLGWSETISSNSTVIDSEGLGWSERIDHAAQNLLFTTVPVLFRDVTADDHSTRLPIARVRDRYFDAVQSSALMIGGIAGVLVAILGLWRNRRRYAWPDIRFWVVLLLVAIVLGVGVHTTVIKQGVAQICLLPFAFLVVAFNTARIDESGFARGLLTAGLIVDLLFGILLHFGIESLWILRWLYPDQSAAELIAQLGFAAGSDFASSVRTGQPFLFDLPGAATAGVLCAVTAIVMLRWLFVHKEPAPDFPPDRHES